MYAWMWNKLPEQLALRVVIAFVAFCAVVAALMMLIFPAVEPLLPFNDVSVSTDTEVPAGANTVGGP